MPYHNGRLLISCRAGSRLSRRVLGSALLYLCAPGAFGQADGAQVAANRLEVANDKLKTCLQRHYEPSNGDMAKYRSGDQLIAACRVEWETAESTCAEQPGKTHEYCDAQTKMMLLGFVPMHGTVPLGSGGQALNTGTQRCRLPVMPSGRGACPFKGGG